ncbi:MAG: histidine phosphatase family protein [Clostridia bacterium]|nr:histidine phosphatase family protein [Clostridia bacterium]
MKIIYCHHAMRDVKGKPTQNDGLTDIGTKDANLVAELLEVASIKENLKAIYTSTFFRCTETSKIINKKINLPIINEERFNEFGSIKNESWVDLQLRMKEAIKDIVFKYKYNDTVICVTSGVNIVAFLSLVFKVKVSEDNPFIGVPSCSPLIFNITKDMFND